jgi:hypothetical protein
MASIARVLCGSPSSCGRAKRLSRPRRKASPTTSSSESGSTSFGSRSLSRRWRSTHGKASALPTDLATAFRIQMRQGYQGLAYLDRGALDSLDTHAGGDALGSVPRVVLGAG